MFELDAHLSARRTEVEAALDKALPPALLPPARLHEAMRYSVMSPGKRLRPILCLTAADAAGSRQAGPAADAAMRAAVALELFHTYTLIHDDLPCMDDDDLRRGRPTCHVVFGEAVAVLAGDALQCLAFEMLARADDAATGARLATELGAAGGSTGVVGGQVDDLHIPAEGLDEQSLGRIHRMKTAALFSAAARMGGIAAGAPAQAIDALGRYGTATGMAFQLVDDLLDAGEGGKPGETSCLLVYDAAEARRRVRAFTADALEALEQVGQPGRVLPLRAITELLQGRTV